MGRIKQNRNANVVVFSQWSRKAYAVFASLKKVIRIAGLSVDICQSSLLKSSAYLRILAYEEKNDFQEDSEIPDDQTQLLLGMWPVLPVFELVPYNGVGLLKLDRNDYREAHILHVARYGLFAWFMIERCAPFLGREQSVFHAHLIRLRLSTQSMVHHWFVFNSIKINQHG